MFLTDDIANIGAEVQFYPCFKLSFSIVLENITQSRDKIEPEKHNTLAWEKCRHFVTHQLRNKRKKNSYWWRITTHIWQWNFCVRFSDVISRGNQWWRVNGRNNSQHCCANNVGSCCVSVGSGVQTDATTPNNVGTCSASWEGYNPQVFVNHA